MVQRRLFDHRDLSTTSVAVIGLIVTLITSSQMIFLSCWVHHHTDLTSSTDPGYKPRNHVLPALLRICNSSALFWPNIVCIVDGLWLVFVLSGAGFEYYYLHFSFLYVTSPKIYFAPSPFCFMAGPAHIDYVIHLFITSIKASQLSHHHIGCVITLISHRSCHRSHQSHRNIIT